MGGGPQSRMDPVTFDPSLIQPGPSRQGAGNVVPLRIERRPDAEAFAVDFIAKHPWQRPAPPTPPTEAEIAARTEVERERRDTERDALATAIAAKLAASSAPAASSPESGYTTTALFDDYIRSRKARGVKPGSIRFLQGLTKKLTGYLPRFTRDLDGGQGHQALLKYRETRNAEGAPERVNKELRMFKAAWKLAWKSDLVKTPPDKLIPELKSHTEARERWLPPHEVWLIVRALEGRSEEGRDHAACFAWSQAVGADHASWANAKRTDIRADRKGCTVHGTKNDHRKDYFAPTLLAAQRELVEYALANADGTGGALFRPWGTTNANRDLKIVCKRLGLESTSTHDARRTYQAWYEDAGVQRDHIDVALGHKPRAVLEKHYKRGVLPDVTLLRLFAQDMRAAAHRAGEADVEDSGERPADGRARPAEAGEDPSTRPTDCDRRATDGSIAQSVELRTFNP